MTDHLIILVDVRRSEIDEDINDEHDVNDEVNDGQGFIVAVVVSAATRTGTLVLLVEKKGSHVWSDDGGVDDQDKDEPVPDGLERRVVQNGEPMDTRRLQLVLWENLSTQGQDLQGRSEVEGQRQRGTYHRYIYTCIGATYSFQDLSVLAIL